MIAVSCPRHPGRVLLDLAHIEQLRPVPAGFEVSFRCLCGHRGSDVVGRRRAPTPAGHGHQPAG